MLTFANVKQFGNTFALAQQRATFAVRTTLPEPVPQAGHSQKGGVADN